jgi:gas vesicle protein
MATADAARPTAGVKRRVAPRDDDDQDLDVDLDPEREEQFDLLTAAVIGMAVGAGIALLVRRGPSGVRPIRPAFEIAGRSARWAGGHGLRGARLAGVAAAPAAVWAGRRAHRGAEWARARGDELLERLPALEDVTGAVTDYVDAAREAINDTVEDEIRGLRKAIRKQRKRIGI